METWQYAIGSIVCGASSLVILAWLAVLAWPTPHITQDQATKQFIQNRARYLNLTEQEFMSKYYPPKEET